MRLGIFAAAGALAVFWAGAAMAGPTIGTNDSGNCYPGLCNDSGSSSGLAIDYQQVYAASAFSGPTAISSITFFYDSIFGGPSFILSGDYSISLGYTQKAVNGLSPTLASNVFGSETMFLSSVQNGTNNANPSVSIIGSSPFSYNPANGNLLLEIVVTNQANVPNAGVGNTGYFEADDTGLQTSRAYCVPTQGCFADSTGLVTQFGTTALPVPEPMTLSVFGVGLAGAAALRRKSRKA